MPARFFRVIRLYLLVLACCAPAHAQDWLYYGGGQGGAHHSALSQINRDNVGKLELAWSFRTGELARHPEHAAMASFHATPLLTPKDAGESLVFCTPFNRIIGLDPASGEERWVFDPELELAQAGVRFNCRGIAYWRNDEATTAACAHRLFMGTQMNKILRFMHYLTKIFGLWGILHP